MGVIIGAAIALLILVLLSVLIFRAGGTVSEGTSCQGVEGYECVPDDQTCTEALGPGYIASPRTGCFEGDKCCIPFG